MSWPCPECQTMILPGSLACPGCGLEVRREPGGDTEPDPEPEPLTKAKIELMTAIGDRFGELIQGKTLDEVIKPGDLFDATEVMLRSLAARMQTGQRDLLSTIVLAISWGIYVAEQRQTHLSEDLTSLH